MAVILHVGVGHPQLPEDTQPLYRRVEVLEVTAGAVAFVAGVVEAQQQAGPFRNIEQQLPADAEVFCIVEVLAAAGGADRRADDRAVAETAHGIDFFRRNDIAPEPVPLLVGQDQLAGDGVAQ